MADVKVETTSTLPSDTPSRKVVAPVRGGKVVVHLRAVGNAPILIQKKFKISADEQFQAVHDFLGKQLKLSNEESLYLFVNSAFAPSPDERIRDLAECYHTNGALIINYAFTPAWG